MMDTTTNYKWRWVVAGLVLLIAAGCAQSSQDRAQSLTVVQAKALIEAHHLDDRFVILDVRTPSEFQQGHIAGAVLLDYYSPEFKQGLSRLDKTKTYLIYCRSGNRSGKTLKWLAELDFDQVYHMSGGVLAWQTQNLPLVR